MIKESVSADITSEKSDEKFSLNSNSLRSGKLQGVVQWEGWRPAGGETIPTAPLPPQTAGLHFSDIDTINASRGLPGGLYTAHGTRSRPISEAGHATCGDSSVIFTDRFADTTAGDSNTNGGHSNSNKPVRRLTTIDGVAILVGIIIGSGIFSSPGLALQRCGSAGSVLLAWAVSGGLVMMASFCYLELGSMIPSAGGDFDYLHRAFGERLAFSFAWFNFWVGKTSSQAVIATIFGRYFETVVSGNVHALRRGAGAGETPIAKMSAVVLIVLVAGMNCTGAKESAVLSIALTATKVLLVLAIFVFALVYVCYAPENAATAQDNLSGDSAFGGSHGLFGFGSGMVACLWSFDGFADGNFLLEELVHPARDFPRILFLGLTTVTLCYILINIGYLSVLEKQVVEDAQAIAVEFGHQVSTSLFAHAQLAFPLVLALGVSLSAAGSVNGSAMTGGRAFFAVAREGKAPAALAMLNRWGAPWVSLLAQAAWSIVLLLLPGSSFSALLDYFGPTAWLFYALSAASLMRLRYLEPHTPRPFRVPLYPLPPLVVMSLALVIVVSALMTEPLFVLLALGFVLLSFPVHLLIERSAERRLDRLGERVDTTEHDGDGGEAGGRMGGSSRVVSASAHSTSGLSVAIDDGEESDESDEIGGSGEFREAKETGEGPAHTRYTNYAATIGLGSNDAGNGRHNNQAVVAVAPAGGAGLRNRRDEEDIEIELSPFGTVFSPLATAAATAAARNPSRQ